MNKVDHIRTDHGHKHLYVAWINRANCEQAHTDVCISERKLVHGSLGDAGIKKINRSMDTYWCIYQRGNRCWVNSTHTETYISMRNWSWYHEQTHTEHISMRVDVGTTCKQTLEPYINENRCWYKEQPTLKNTCYWETDAGIKNKLTLEPNINENRWNIAQNRIGELIMYVWVTKRCKQTLIWQWVGSFIYKPKQR